MPLQFARKNLLIYSGILYVLPIWSTIALETCWYPLLSPLGMRPTIIVCVNRRLGYDKPSCAGRGSEALADALDSAVYGTDAAVVRIKCFGRCADGPIVRVAPGGRFFKEARVEDIAQMLAALNAQPDAQQ
jgi:(2Fe-2S) ferredoxin